MNWVKEIEVARSVEDVLELVNEFLTEQTEAFWTRVPKGVRPPSVETEEELHTWHHRMVHELMLARHTSMELQDLCVVFVRASVRVHQIALREAGPGSSSNDDLSFAPVRRRRRG